MTTDRHTDDELAAFAEIMSHEEEPGERSPEAERARRARRRRGLLVTAIIAVIVLAASGGYIGWALNAPLPAPEATVQQQVVAQPGPEASLSLPAQGASAISVAGADDYLGAEASGIWQTSGSDEPRSIASLTKLITALVILDAYPLAEGDPGPTITFSEADHDLYDAYYVRGATIAAMPAGSSMSLRDALATMLIPSASNYAHAVSSWAFGSQGAFVGAAREWLAANGMTSTTIVEPTGLDPDNTSTPTDLMTLGRIAASDPTVAGISATPSLTLPGPGPMNNTNTLLGVDGITGLKTGNLGEGSFSLLYTARMDAGTGQPLSVTGVILGGHSRATTGAAARATLSSLRNGFHDVPVAEEGQIVGSYKTAWGASARLVVADDASIFTWSDTAIEAEMETTAPTTYEDGETVGTLMFTAGPSTTTVDLVVEGSIAPPTDWWRLTHPSELGRK